MLHEPSIIPGEAVQHFAVDDDAANPLREAQKALALDQASLEQQATANTKEVTEQLKLLYHKMSDEHGRSTGMINHVEAALRALRDENFALGAALDDKGVPRTGPRSAPASAGCGT